MKARICPKCEHQNLSYAKYCAACGEAIPVRSLPLEDIDSHASKRTSPPSIQEVTDQLEKLENPKQSVWKNLLYLGLSLIVFISFGLISNPVVDLAIIVGVLLFHETGHFIAMKLFGYKDVKMFFIPLFGAAVSGDEQNISATKKAIVTLAGPMPGIFLAFVFGIASAIFDSSLLDQISLILIVINGFNLLPIYPFDGGRFLFEVVFSRTTYGEAIFRIIAATALIVGAFYLQDVFIGTLGFFGLISIGPSVKIASLSKELKMEHDFSAYSSLLDTPSEIIEKVIMKTKIRFPNQKDPKFFATQALEIWKRLSAKHPSTFASVALIMLYLFPLGFIFLIIFLANI